MQKGEKRNRKQQQWQRKTEHNDCDTLQKYSPGENE